MITFTPFKLFKRIVTSCTGAVFEKPVRNNFES